MRRMAIGGMLLIVAACGGSAVVDPVTTSGSGGTGASAGTGGTGGTGGNGGTGGTGTTTTGVAGGGGAGGAPLTCDDLTELLIDKVAAALQCSPELSVEQCTGEEMVYDTCACELAANVLNPEAAQAARDAFDVWVAAGCGPMFCYYCPVPLPAYCEPSAGSGTGTCGPAAN